jgi:hypothetical protein
MIGVQGFNFQQGLGIFLFTTLSRPALIPTHPPIQWVPGALSSGVKQSGHETNHSPPSSVEVKYAWCYTSIPQYIFMAWCLVKHRDNFTFTLLVLYELGFLCLFTGWITCILLLARVGFFFCHIWPFYWG